MSDGFIVVRQRVAIRPQLVTRAWAWLGQRSRVPVFDEGERMYVYDRSRQAIVLAGTVRDSWAYRYESSSEAVDLLIDLGECTGPAAHRLVAKALPFGVCTFLRIADIAEVHAAAPAGLAGRLWMPLAPLDSTA